MKMDSTLENLPNEQWDLYIEPKRSLLDLRLGELRRARDLIMLFVRRDFGSVYKQTILGLLWYLIQPLLTTITFTVALAMVRSLMQGIGCSSRTWQLLLHN